MKLIPKSVLTDKLVDDVYDLIQKRHTFKTFVIPSGHTVLLPPPGSIDVHLAMVLQHYAQQNIDYESLTRRVLYVHELKPGDDGRVLASDGSWIYPSDFKAISHSSMAFDVKRDELEDNVQRIASTGVQEVMESEDKILVDLLEDQIKKALPTHNLVCAQFNEQAFKRARTTLEIRRLIVDSILINRADLAQLALNMGSMIDPCGNRDMLLTGYLGRWEGIKIQCAPMGVPERIPQGTMYFVPEPSYLGVLNIRVPPFCEPFWDDKSFGIATAEVISGCIPDPNRVVKLSLI